MAEIEEESEQSPVSEYLQESLRSGTLRPTAVADSPNQKPRITKKVAGQGATRNFRSSSNSRLASAATATTTTTTRLDSKVKAGASCRMPQLSRSNSGPQISRPMKAHNNTTTTNNNINNFSNNNKRTSGLRGGGLVPCSETSRAGPAAAERVADEVLIDTTTTTTTTTARTARTTTTWKEQQKGAEDMNFRAGNVVKARCTIFVGAQQVTLLQFVLLLLFVWCLFCWYLWLFPKQL
ncbi:unnamed protein product [Polarella glacialis]|uniref:Uncharacterized protein n=1 Tax=Polarella glacialis TaxID=89957 RepID=A0A813F8J9_POLGL|nr:unnamed protein product [Polarella glacialis]